MKWRSRWRILGDENYCKAVSTAYIFSLDTGVNLCYSLVCHAGLQEKNEMRNGWFVFVVVVSLTLLGAYRYYKPCKFFESTGLYTPRCEQEIDAKSN